ncbi:DUF1775 domain-containing protein [Streptomyces coelicoflavus]|uniref:DUF1775 domain-containing protein n=2 Tax=Streptomyces TaxID=1883 RepID=A0A369UVD7_9ACTN|nr:MULTISPECIES: DUF1775 domain-containing protein [Streptomyces]MYS46638.1 DUF1775 domain-containing protein [Streptomyces sp. SID5998]WDI21499.1 DUF1775 domain-containing protein [Streptomyces enissocaesilis]AIV33348.1 hypothetical protein NI25_07370 [Streptomyces sp. CCM_MD2014]MCT7350630.1 DUF1775 domain-containing protein [Streptomyces sp. 15-116A]MCW1097622.1 DUF1775 domain-containing protein [Streptomyces sp. RS2]
MSSSPHGFGRVTRRLGVVSAFTLTAALALTGTAAAHSEVEADNPQALAENVTLTFVSEAESDSAGFTQLRVVLPDGIAPGDVTLGEAPKGWKLKAGDDGYTLGGPTLKMGVDAEYQIKVRQLPDAESLAFKTIETYSDGKISRWIELSKGGEESEQPAPVLELKAAAPGATPISPSPRAPETPSPTPSTTTPSSPTASADTTETAADEKDEDSSTGLVIGGIVVALAVLGGGAWWLMRRRTPGSQS